MRFGQAATRNPTGAPIGANLPAGPSGGGGTLSAGQAPAIPLPLPEGQVAFDSVLGHAHDGSDAHTVDHANLANVTANQHHNQQHVLSGGDHTESGLTAGNVLTALTATTFGWQAPAAASGGGLDLLGAWNWADITTLTVSLAEIRDAFYGTTVNAPQAAGFTGSLRRLVITLSADVGPIGTSVTCTVYKNGAATTLAATVTGAGGVEQTAVANLAAGTETFAAGDLLTVYASRNGLVTSAALSARVYGST